MFSACLRIDVPASVSDGHVKLVMCFVEVWFFERRLICYKLTVLQSRSMEMWTAALKWAMDNDSIVNAHNIAVSADAESAKMKSSVAGDPLTMRSPAAAVSPMTPRQFSLSRDSLTIPLDDDVRQPMPFHFEDYCVISSLQVLQQLREERSRMQLKVTPPQSPVCLAHPPSSPVSESARS